MYGNKYSKKKCEKINELENIPEKKFSETLKSGTKWSENRKEMLGDTDNRDHGLSRISNLYVPEEGW